jgi:predicted nucleic acid-binding Zn ribbon protein
MTREDDDGYAGFDTSDPDDDTTAPCPHCGELIYEDAERCPECGQYLSRDGAPTARKPKWILIGALICLAIVLAWVFLGM